MLAAGACAVISAAVILANPAAFPDCGFHAGGSLQVHWCRADVSDQAPERKLNPNAQILPGRQD